MLYATGFAVGRQNGECLMYRKKQSNTLLTLQYKCITIVTIDA
jgi:hypothetical protein